MFGAPSVLFTFVSHLLSGLAAGHQNTDRFVPNWVKSLGGHTYLKPPWWKRQPGYFPLSCTYIPVARPSGRMLLRQAVCCAFAFALLSAGNKRLARMAMIAIPTSSSINVTASRLRHWLTTSYLPLPITQRG